MSIFYTGKNLSQDASLKAKISLLRLRHTFLAILMERKQKSEVHTIKPSVIDHIFNLKIGSERRSMKVCILSNDHGTMNPNTD